MELALYCPEIGYYERTLPGRKGDFYTSVSSGNLFGRLLAFQFAEWLEQLPVDRLQLVEAGAHDGALASDILKWLHDHRLSLLPRLEYWILEPSARRQTWQKATLDDFAGLVRWHRDWKSVPADGIAGIIFSNELLDAFPLRRFGWDAVRRHWFEWGVALEKNNFVWARMAASGDELKTELRSAGIELSDELLAVLPDEFTIELTPATGRWWQQAAGALCCGRLLTFDYGFEAEEWIRPERVQGTLRAYRKHALSADALADPGGQDLTAHVNFTHLQLAGEAADLRTEGLWSQAQFLTSIVQRMCNHLPPSPNWSRQDLRQFQTLTHPEHLGRAFRVLVQTRRCLKK